MDLSVIIVNYNVRQFLENALTSIGKAMEGLEGEVFVVDNASDDGSVEMLHAKFPQVILIENQRNLGFARANNLALQRARGDFILLINPDTIVQEDTLQVMLKFFRDTPDAGLAGCKILNPDGSFQLACRRSFPTPWVAFTRIFGLGTLFPRSRAFGKYNLTYLSRDETYEVDAVSGSFMMVRREVYESIGGLDESFFMYGEDLDWCYRIGRSGYKVYYVHATKIIHFKGESTRRSDLDELRLFYQAMQLFVEKHFSGSFIVELFLTIGITLRAALAFLVRTSRPFLMALTDFLLVTGALIAAELLYFGHLFRFPGYAYPIVWTVPALTVVLAMYVSGQYTSNRFSVVNAGTAVLVSYTVISATVFFAKDFAFSRAVVLISGILVFLLVPGWRLAFRRVSRSAAHGRGRRTLFGRRTLIVGTGPSALTVLRKLRTRVDDGYDVLGFVSTHRKQVGEKIAGLEVIGSIDNVGKVISERKVSEVIFSTDSLAYTDILSVISRSKEWSVNFRLVPNSLEAIIGKTRIDELDTLPLVEIEYNVHKPVNRGVKRLFDVVVSLLLLVTVYPWMRLRTSSHAPSSREGILLLPQVLRGRLSLVGRPLSDPDGETTASPFGSKDRTAYLGPKGLTGLVQINEREGLEQDEREKYRLYYAKNQSVILDLEIMLKALLLHLKQRKGSPHG
jgi:GT2 family glycosyltransferase/lipopolysaccharide/colanic/teichoic acid biosynthesis glycosyltransferase